MPIASQKPRKHKYRHLAAMLYGVPLAITPEKLSTIVEVFELRRSGLEFTDEELRARIGAWMDDGDEPDDDEDDKPPYTISAGGVAVIPVQGVLARKVDWMEKMSGAIPSESVAAAVEQALADPAVQSIVLDIDSPGGEAAGVAEAAERMLAARGKKPMVAVANGQMASGAYWLGSTADSIAITPSSEAGSIGVIGVHREASKAAEKNGVQYTVVSAGRHKADANSYEPLSKQGRATLQEEIDDAYASFTAAVARNRATTVEAVQSGYGQGKAFAGQKAVETKLADRVATLDQVVSELGARSSGPAVRTAGNFSIASSAAAGPEPPAPRPSLQEIFAMNPKLKAALFARGLIAAIDSTDELATVALNAFFTARGETPPTDPQAAVNALMTAAVKPVPAAQTCNPQLPAPDATAETDRIRVAAAKAERERIDAIQTRGRLLGIDAAAIQSSIDAGDDLGTALTKFTAGKAAKEAPITVTAGAAQADVFAAAAVEAIVFRCAMEPRDHRGRPIARKGQPEPKPLSAAARDLRYSRLVDIGAMALRGAGRETRGMDSEDVAAAWLGMGMLPNGEQEVFRLGAWDGSSYQTPSDYPNILSAIAGKMMDIALQTNTSTFREWCAEMPAVPDFKPKTIIAVGGFGELPFIPDGDDVVQSKRAEEASFIAADSYGDKAVLTPVMIANDDLGFFNEILSDKVIAHELTLNRLCVNLLLGNVTCADGNPLFGSVHANRITAGSGGAPSVAQTNSMRALMRAQTDVGAQRKMRVGPRIALIGSNWETAADQVYQVPPDGIYYPADTNINVFRRSIKPILEQQIDDGTSLLPWYLMGDPREVRSIVFCFQTGFEGGKVLMYFDPSKRSRIYQIEGRFAAAVRNWRGIVRNSGGDGNF